MSWSCSFSKQVSHETNPQEPGLCTFRVPLPELTVPSGISVASAVLGWASVRPEQLGVRLNIHVPLTSPHPPTRRRQRREQIRACYGLLRPHFLRDWAWRDCPQQGTRIIPQAPPDGHPSGWPGERQTVLLDDHNSTEQQNAPWPPLKYSRCPSTDGKTLRKPPINFYGDLRSRLGIITFVFTRQGTRTTRRWTGTRPTV